ncbi:hypothetical protein PybrP1_006335 [[Pythium] brassicae (nom. inval.)]|nr:hypothetical protein PybrP1_006335 [[Pythium] brassicae (nom. inval.)]
MTAKVLRFKESVLLQEARELERLEELNRSRTTAAVSDASFGRLLGIRLNQKADAELAKFRKFLRGELDDLSQKDAETIANVADRYVLDE